MTPVDPKRAVAENAADGVLLRYGHLPMTKRARLWKAAFDAVLAGLAAYEELAATERARARAAASEN